LTSESRLTAGEVNADRVDAFAVAQAWYGYAQEPLPDPGELPGSNKEITDRARQRLPQHMSTLLFRGYPALAQRFMAERLQLEGWFDDQDWEISGWFQDSNDQFPDGSPARVGGGRNWSLEAWERARDRWRADGESNHLLFTVPEQEENMRVQERQFRARYRLHPEDPLPVLREANLDPLTREGYRAAQFLRDYKTSRAMTYFPHHYHRSLVEARRETVAARKLVFEAEELNQEGKRPAALRKLEEAVPLWRDKVLRPNKEFRRDEFIQEQTFELQWKYQTLDNRVNGKGVKVRVAQALRLVPLAPARLDLFPRAVFQGPFDITDEEGQPYIAESSRQAGLRQLEMIYGLGRPPSARVEGGPTPPLRGPGPGAQGSP
jgi:hypothetical protein